MSTSLDASRLEALLESAQLLHSSLNIEDLLRHLLRSVMGRLLISKGLIAVEEDGAMRLALARGSAQADRGREVRRRDRSRVRLGPDPAHRRPVTSRPDFWRSDARATRRSATKR